MTFIKGMNAVTLKLWFLRKGNNSIIKFSKKKDRTYNRKMVKEIKRIISLLSAFFDFLVKNR